MPINKIVKLISTIVFLHNVFHWTIKSTFAQSFDQHMKTFFSFSMPAFKRRHLVGNFRKLIITKFTKLPWLLKRNNQPVPFSPWTRRMLGLFQSTFLVKCGQFHDRTLILFHGRFAGSSTVWVNIISIWKSFEKTEPLTSWILLSYNDL